MAAQREEMEKSEDGSSSSSSSSSVLHSLMASFGISDYKKKNEKSNSSASSASSYEKESEQKEAELVMESDAQLRRDFLQRCFYVQGQYDRNEDYERLAERARELEQVDSNKDKKDSSSFSSSASSSVSNRIFILDVPPPEFKSAVEGIDKKARSSNGWTRVVVEKPFGESLADARALNSLISSSFREEEVYRIDHFVGKDAVRNIVPLRFANASLLSLWDRQHIASIVINVKEDFGLEGRVGYYEKSGVLKDMFQNHLLSILAFLTMEEPGEGEEGLQKAKTELFKSMKPFVIDDLVLGQYGASEDGKKVAYKDEKDVEKSTRTATCATLVAHIDNERWRGVPIVLHCGKALNEKKSEIYVHFRAASSRSKLYPNAPANSLHISLAPECNIVHVLNVKQAGLAAAPRARKLELEAEAKQELQHVPSAYEALVFDVLRGDRHLFVSYDETEAAWAVIDPLLKALEEQKTKPCIYQFGSHGPKEAQQLFDRYHLPVKIESL